MGLLGDFLPKGVTDAASNIGDGISNAASSVSNFITKGTSNFSLADAGKKLGEGANKLIGSFGNALGFKKLAGGAPTADLADLLKQQGIGMGAGQTLSDSTETAAPRENLDDVIVSLISTVTGDVVFFEVSPRVGEQRGAQYTELNITHHPGTILKYDRTASRTWSVNARLVSRTQAEASKNQQYLNIIRSWVMPFYGSGTEAADAKLLGAPPPILKFSGYGDKNISPVPVVMESYSTNWPNDVDYIPTEDGTPFPVIIDVDVTLKEAYSPKEYSGFDLFAYKTGNLGAAFTSESAFGKAKGNRSHSKTDTSDPPVLGEGPAISGVPSAKDLSGAVNGALYGIKDKLPSLSSLTNKLKSDNSKYTPPADLKDTDFI